MRKINLNLKLNQSEIKPSLEVIGFGLKIAILAFVMMITEIITTINALFEIIPELHAFIISVAIIAIAAICLVVTKPIEINVQYVETA